MIKTMKDTQGNIITEEEFTKDIGHGVLLPNMTTQNKTMQERFDEEISKSVSEAIEYGAETKDVHQRLKSFIKSEIALAIDNRNREVFEMIRKLTKEVDPLNQEEGVDKSYDYEVARNAGYNNAIEEVLSTLTSYKRD